MRRAALPLSILLVFLPACRDPEAGPPPRRLDARQQAEVARHTLAGPPAPRFVPPGGPAALGGGAVRYLGMDVAPVPARRGEALTLTHYWTADRPVEGDWKVFVHLTVPGRPAPVVNADHHPVGGLWPTSRWEPGRIYADVHEVVVPRHLAPGTLDVRVGLYRLDGRMPVDRRASQDGSDRVRAGRLPLEGGVLPVPTYRAPRAARPPALDGVLDEPTWAEAPVATLVRSGDGRRPALATTARLAWDDTHLYVAFEVEDPDVWSDFQADDDPLYEQEVVEIFIDADGNGRGYDELQLAPTGRIFDARFGAPRRDMDLAWSSGLRVGLQVDGTLNDASDRDRGWTAEIAIPLERLSSPPRLPPQVGDTWRFNLYRLERPGRRGSQGMALSPPDRPDFHRLGRFAELHFVAGAADAPSAPAAADRR